MQRNDINIENMRATWEHVCSRNLPTSNTNDIVIREGDQFGERIVTTDGYKISMVTFNTLDDYIEQVEHMLDGRIEDTDWSNNEGFTWEDSDYHGTKDILSKGIAPNQDILDAYENLKDVVTAKLGLEVPMARCRSARRKRKPTWAGGNVNISKYMESLSTGKVLPCFQGLTKRADRPIVKIGLNTSMSAGNSQVNFGHLAAVASVLCEQMEILGYGVEIYGVDSCRPHNMKNRKHDARGNPSDWDEFWMSTKWLIKSGDDPLDCQRIMSHGMSGLLRCWGFSACYLLHGACNPSSMTCLDTPKEVVQSTGLDVLLEKTWSRTNNEENAERMVGLIEELIDTPSCTSCA